MKRHPTLIPYSSDHHRILVLAQLLKKNAPDYKGLPNDLMGKKRYALHQYEILLKPHEAREELHLFPKIRNLSAEIDELLQQMQDEHLVIDTGFRRMREPEFGINQLHELGLLMEKHVRTEERQLFEMVQKAMSDQELRAISEL